MPKKEKKPRDILKAGVLDYEPTDEEKRAAGIHVHVPLKGTDVATRARKRERTARGRIRSR